MKRIKLFLGFIFLFALCFVTSCEFGGTSKSIDLEETEVTLEVGETYRISPILSGLTSSELTIEVTDSSVASVKNYTVTALAVGKTDIIISSTTDSNIFAALIVNVKGPEVINYSINIQGGNEVLMGETLQLEAILENLSGEVTWSSSSEDKATIEDGLLTANLPGDVIITASLNGYSDSITITIKPIYFIVSFYGEDDTLLESVPTAYGQAAVAPSAPDVEGKSFVGWDTDFSNVTQDLNVKAIYSESNELRVGSGEKYATIGAALNDAQAGSTIIVTAGTYAENITISLDDITILGNNVEVSAYDGPRSNESIINGLLTIAENVKNVTIKGLEFTAKTGIKLAGNNDNIQILNNVFESTFTEAGTSAASNGQIMNGGAVSNLIIKNNYFMLKTDKNYNCNVSLLYTVTNADISDNHLLNNCSESANPFSIWLYKIAGEINVNNNYFDRFAGNYWTVWLGNSSTASGTTINFIDNMLDGRSSSTKECGVSFNNLSSDTISLNVIGNTFINVKDTIIAVVGTSTTDTTSQPHVNIMFNKFVSVSGRMRFCVNNANFKFEHNYLGEGVSYTDQGTPAISAASAAVDDLPTEEQLDKAYQLYKDNLPIEFISITYELNGGTVKAADKILKGCSYTLPIPYKLNSVFLGWSYSESGDTYIDVLPTTLTEDVKLYALWDDALRYNVTYNFAGGYSEELFMTGIDDAPNLTINNYNFSNGSFWGGRYTSDIFIGTNGYDPKATFSDRIYIGKDTETGLYKVVEVLASGASSWPEGAEYVITISNSYTGYYANIQPITKQIVKGMYVAFGSNFELATVDNPVRVGFFDKEPTETTISLVVTENDSLIVPGRLGFRFLGWFDSENKKYSAFSDLTGDVELTAQWEELNPVTSIEVTSCALEMYTEDVQQVEAHVLPSDAYFQQIIYSSSNTDILTVSSSGLIKAVNAGTATITMKDYLGKVIVEKEITVYPQNTIDVKSDDIRGVLEPGDELQLSIELIGKEADSATYTISSSNTAVFEVNSEGHITAIGEGTANLTIVSTELDVQLELPIIVRRSNTSTDIDKILQLILDNHINFVEAGNVSLYNDGSEKVFRSTYGSVNRFLFDEYVVNEEYYATTENNPNNHKTRRSTDTIEFVTVHDTATLTGTVVSIASGMSSGETSIHYTVGNDAIYGVVPEKYIAYHAGDGTGVTFTWTKTNAVATENVAPELDIIESNDKYYITVNGVQTTVSVPLMGTRAPQKSDFTVLGPVWKVENGYYYIGGPLWYSYSQIGSRGGNNNSIGIEMCVNLSGDIYDTWQRTAQLVSDILIRNELDLNRVKMHNTWSGKNCPQCLIEGTYWTQFMEMVEVNYAIQSAFEGCEITIESNNPDIIDNTGRVIAAPLTTTVVSYDLTVSYGGETRTITLYSVVTGSCIWEQWNGTYSATRKWNQGNYVR